LRFHFTTRRPCSLSSNIPVDSLTYTYRVTPCTFLSIRRSVLGVKCLLVRRRSIVAFDLPYRPRVSTSRTSASYSYLRVVIMQRASTSNVSCTSPYWAPNTCPMSKGGKLVERVRQIQDQKLTLLDAHSPMRTSARPLTCLLWSRAGSGRPSSRTLLLPSVEL
jgi:hypothetical protein